MSRKAASAEMRVSSSVAPQRQAVLYLQRDALRIAYLLTGDAGRARDLTTRALVELLADDDRRDDPGALSDDLLLTIARLDRETDGPPPIGEMLEADDERARLRAALDELERPLRAALVLHDVAGVELRRVAALVDLGPGDLEYRLEAARARLLDAARTLSDDPLRRLIAGLAVDAPRADLWPEVGPQLRQRRAERRRQTRLLAGGIIGAALLVLLGGAAWFFSDALFSIWEDDEVSAVAPETATPAPTRPPRPTATPAPTRAVPDMIEGDVTGDLLVAVRDGEASTGRTQLMVYDPESHTFSDPYGDATSMFVSAAGRWTLLVRYEPAEVTDPNTGETYQGEQPFISAMRDGERMGWEFKAPSIAVQPAIVGDRFYLFSQEEDEARIIAYDLLSGEEIASQTLEYPEFEDDAADPEPINLYVDLNFISFPDASEPRLFLSAHFWASTEGRSSQRVMQRIYRVGLNDLGLTLLHEETVDDDDTTGPVAPEFPVWNTKVTPDGSAFYTWQRRSDGRPAAVYFLDLASGEVETLAIPFMPVEYYEDDRRFQGFEVLSNSGRWLYMISSDTYEITIIDLVERRVERLFALDTGGFEDVSFASWQQALSHDGRYLYVVEADDGRRRPPSGGSIWVIDLSRWRIVRRLEVEGPGELGSIHLSTDGSRLYAYSFTRSQNPEDVRRFITTFDTATGDVLDHFEPSASGIASWSWEQSATERYRMEFGRTPVIDGVEPEDVTEYATLPRVEVEAAQEVLPLEATHEVSLRFLDPLTGREIARGNGHTRLDPKLPVTLVLEHPGAKSVVTAPVELDPGSRRGSFRPRNPGLWSARVIVGDPDDGGWSVLLPDVVTVVETQEATDGRRYYLRLTTIPPDPLPFAAEILLRASFVEARTGEPLPEDVELVGGMPEDIITAVDLVGSGTSRIERLEPARHGVYKAEAELQGAGPWRIRFSFDLPDADGEQIRVRGGQIDVAR